MVSSFVTPESYFMSFPFYDRIEESEWLHDSLNLNFARASSILTKRLFL